MSIYDLKALAPLIACAIIIIVHSIILLPTKKFHLDHRLEHHCVICAYLLFAIYYYSALLPHLA